MNLIAFNRIVLYINRFVDLRYWLNMKYNNFRYNQITQVQSHVRLNFHFYLPCKEYKEYTTIPIHLHLIDNNLVD